MSGPPRTLADLVRPERPGVTQLPLALQSARRVTAPEFAGVTFLEVETKSALNRVHGMPFGWSINPYRGCTHACSYCVSGDTPILMADGRLRPMATLGVGDGVYGTRRDGAHRRLARTEVLDHWSVTRAAYRVRLEDGTALVTGGAHRFLTQRGWLRVIAQGAGWPHLSPGDRVCGVPGRTALDTTGHGAHPPRASVLTRATLEGRRVTAATRVVAVEPLGVELPLYDMTTGTGDYISNGVVSHNCFARPSHRYLELSPGEDFERRIVVKTNVVEVLTAELARPSWAGELVALGTNTDPYQRCEGRYRLMPGIVRALAAARTPISILTKGTLITRDRALLAEAAAQVDVTAALTVGMLDEHTWRTSEPGTPGPRARLDAVAALDDAGVPTGVMLAPIMPGINDDRAELAELVDAAVAAGATHVTPIVLHLRPGVKEVFWPWLREHHPELVARYRRLYRGSQADAAYRRDVHEFVAQRRRAALRRHGRSDRPAPPRGFRSGAGRSRTDPAEVHAAQQLKLL